MTKYKIIYILGSGHSGSTLLDMSLGTHPKVFSAGEVAFYSHYIEQMPHKKIDKKIGFACTCGKRISNCKFWQQVSRQVDISWPIIKNRGQLDTYKIFFNIINPFEKWFSFKTKISSNRKVYDAIFREAKKTKPDLRYIVDSSKDPRRLYELIKDPEIDNNDLMVIYLIRDGRAYVHSYNKDVDMISGVTKRNVLLTIIEWIGVQIASNTMLHKYPVKAQKITYKSLTLMPEKTFNNLYSLLKIKRSVMVSTLLKKINKHNYHNLHGSLSKFKTYKNIRYDTSWKKKLTIKEGLISNIFLYVPNKLWNK